jgi:hypothetical protein
VYSSMMKIRGFVISFYIIRRSHLLEVPLQTYSLEKLDSFVNLRYDRKTTVSPRPSRTLLTR